MQGVVVGSAERVERVAGGQEDVVVDLEPGQDLRGAAGPSATSTDNTTMMNKKYFTMTTLSNFLQLDGLLLHIHRRHNCP